MNLFNRIFTHKIAATIFVILVLFTTGCGRQDRRLRLGSFDREGSTSEVYMEPTGSSNPWVLWGPGKTFSGKIITNSVVRKGDNFFNQRQYQEAIASYKDALKSNLSFPERESTHYRLASAFLATNNSREALKSLSEFFKASHASPKEIRGPRTLFLAIGYGADRNYSQSIAWFLKAQHDKEVSPERLRESFSTLLASIAPEEFEGFVTTVPKEESLLTSLIASERAYRNSPSYTYASFAPFIERRPSLEASDNQQDQSPSQLGESIKDKLYVLLPLTGKYGTLGKKVQRGIEVALSEVVPIPFEVQFHELSELKEDIATQMWQLLSGNNGNVSFLGPLLADAADVVGDIGRQGRAPVVTFTKKASFATGDGIFRLGFTAVSQMNRIGDYLASRPGPKNYALIYSDDSNGQELYTALKNANQNLGLSVGFERSFSRGNLNQLSTIAQEFETQELGIVVFIGGTEAATRFFSALTPQVRERIQPIGTALWDDPQAMKRSQEALNGSLFVSLFNKFSPRPLVQDFVNKYTSTYGEAPDFLAAQGYDGMKLLLEAERLKTAKSFTNNAEALRELPAFEGLTGTISSTTTGEFSRRYPLVRFKDGAFTEYETIDKVNY